MLVHTVSAAEPAVSPLNYPLLYQHPPCCPPTSNQGGGYECYLPPKSRSLPLQHSLVPLCLRSFIHLVLGNE